MALPAAAVIEVRAGGSDSNGGGFNSARGGVDYTLQDAAQATGTATAVGTTLTATTAIFTSQMVGNYITDGTTWVEITAFTSTTIVTIDRDPSWTGASIKVGGGLASPGMAAGVRVLGNTVFIKYNASPYVMSSTSANVSGGKIDITYSGLDSVADYWVGYDSTRTVGNMNTNRPTIQVASSGVTSITMFRYASGSTVHNLIMRNIILDGNSKSSIQGFRSQSGNAGNFISLVTGLNFDNSAFFPDTGAIFSRCSASGCSTAAAFEIGSTPAYFFSCVATDNTVSGFRWAGASTVVLDRCISANNSGGSSSGFDATAGGVGGKLNNCVAYNNGLDGFRFASGNARGPAAINCIAYGNAGYGFNNAGGSPTFAVNNAGGDNTSGNENGITISFNFATLSGDPFTDAASGDFSLNNTAGAGADCRAAGVPGTFPGGLTTSYLDIGAAQHQDSGGGGGGGVMGSRIFTGF